MSLVKSKNFTHSTSIITARLYLINFIFLEQKIFQFLSSGFQNIFLLLAFCIIKQFVNSSHAGKKKNDFFEYIKISSLLQKQNVLKCHQNCNFIYWIQNQLYLVHTKYAETYLKLCQTSTMNLFCKNSYWLTFLTPDTHTYVCVIYFHKKVPSSMFNGVAYTSDTSKITQISNF